MEKNTRIIELFGLPGGGKSTICNEILNSHLRTAKIGEALRLFKKESIAFKLSHLPILKWLKFGLIVLTIPNKKRNSKIIYLEFFYIILSYHYAKYQKHFDYLIVDHGLCQQLGSMLHVNDFIIKKNTLSRFSELVLSFDNLHINYCSLPQELALERMRQRKRDVGRIDAVMKDTKKAMDLLNKEDELFESVCKSLKESVHILDMTNSVESLKTELLEQLK